MTLDIPTFSKMTLDITAFSITTLSIVGCKYRSVTPLYEFWNKLECLSLGGLYSLVYLSVGKARNLS
jgi:hypothetical protein